ncbi:hypothetical protein MRX96_028181 [Rhipicephalus microplus]
MLARAAHSTSAIERLPRLRKQTDHLLQVIRPDTSTGTKTRRLVDVHCSTFSEESLSLKGYSLVSTNDVSKAAKGVVACPFNQCALGDVFPDTRDTESKRGDKVDQLFQCGLLYGKGSKQPIQHKRPKCPAISPEQHGAVERRRMAADRQQRGLGVSPLGRRFEARACSWALTRGQGLTRMSGIELLGSLRADSL